MDEFGLPLSFGKQAAAAAPSSPLLPPKPEEAADRDGGRGPRGTVGGGKRSRPRHRKPRTIPYSASGSNAVSSSDAADRGWGGRRAGDGGQGGGEAHPSNTAGNGAEHDSGVVGGSQAGVPGQQGDRALNAGVKRPLPPSPSNNESAYNKHTATPHGPRQGGGSRGRGRGGSAGGGGGGAGGGSRGRGQRHGGGGGGGGGGDDRGTQQGGGEGSGFFKESFCEDPWKELLVNKS